MTAISGQCHFQLDTTNGHDDRTKPTSERLAAMVSCRGVLRRCPGEEAAAEGGRFGCLCVVVLLRDSALWRGLSLTLRSGVRKLVGPVFTTDRCEEEKPCCVPKFCCLL